MLTNQISDQTESLTRETMHFSKEGKKLLRRNSLVGRYENFKISAYFTAEQCANKSLLFIIISNVDYVKWLSQGLVQTHTEQ